MDEEERQMDDTTLYDLLIMLGGMLGFGGMRSFERIRGKA